MAKERQISDPDVLKGLAHPLRQRLYRLLIQLGPQPVSVLSDKVDSDHGLVSYHLRELGKRGFIEQAPELARDRRETWWRVLDERNSWDWSDFTTPEARAVATVAKNQMITDQFTRLGEWEQSHDAWPTDWVEASTSSNSYVRLTPAELAEMVDRIHALIREYKDRDDDADREAVFLFLHAFPERP
ncbi:MAG: helix-turn-helix domain-containing protein [Actinocatenispora sp.]